MFYQAEPEALVDVGVDDHAVAAVVEVETINPCPPVLNPNHTIDPDVIVIPDTQPTSTRSANTMDNTSGGSSTPSSRKRTRYLFLRSIQTQNMVVLRQ